MTIEFLILLTGILLLLGITSSKLSARLGLPGLVLFLVLGMLAGSEGIGGIEFDDNDLAYAIGTMALALILFDGGLGTSLSDVLSVWKPASVLATVGVLITAVLTGLAASLVLGIPLLQGLLLGSIVGSTDAAAVFSVLRSGGITLPKRIASTLEVESGSNDPMAIFLTIGCAEVLAGRMPLGPGLLGLFFSQMVVGCLVGLIVGFVAVWVVNRVHLDAAGLYPILMTGFGLLTFGVAAWLHGSGFLAVYLAGMVIGNRRVVFQRGIRLFHDAAAWLAQIVMFVVLGLLSFPTHLLAVAAQGLVIAAVLIFVARPLAVGVTLPWFGFNKREIALISWVGLKGAVPITLATFPYFYEIESAPLIFNVVFFVVVLSATVQGGALSLVARKLGLQLPAEPPPPVTLEISSLRNVEGEVVYYSIAPDSRAHGKTVKDLALPEGAVIALVVREQQIIPPHGRTQLEAGDHVLLVLRPGVLPLVTRVFSHKSSEWEELPQLLEFPLRPTATVGELQEAYGIAMDAPDDWTLEETLREKLADEPHMLDKMVRFGPIALHVRGVCNNRGITRVGMVILPDEIEEPSASEQPPAEQTAVADEGKAKQESPAD